jgi:hypothetical protein
MSFKPTLYLDTECHNIWLKKAQKHAHAIENKDSLKGTIEEVSIWPMV